MAYTVTFHLKSQFHGDAVPVVYGSCPELGDFDHSLGIDLVKVDGIYNYQAKITLNREIKANEIWYAYCFRPSYGSIIPESVPRRFMPAVFSDTNLYDTIDEVTSVNDLVLHFHVRCYTKFGQHLYICGSDKALGAWKPSSAIQLFFEGNSDYWTGNLRLPLSNEQRTIEYKYFRSFNGNEIEWEPADNHKIELTKVTSPAIIEIEDTFRWNDLVMESLSKSIYVDAINNRFAKYSLNDFEKNNLIKKSYLSPNDASPGYVNVRFEAYCPNISTNQNLYVVGSCKEIGDWDVEKAVKMNDYVFPKWYANVQILKSSMPFEYKFIIISKEWEDVEVEVETDNNDNINIYENQNESEQKKKKITEKKLVKKVFWESDANRYCPGITSEIITDDFPVNLVVSNWYVSPQTDLIKRYGIVVPLFSLRSHESCGIGQFTDLIDLVNFVEKIGAAMIQILPVFDTEGHDPFNQISSFAFNPIYINLSKISVNGQPLPKSFIDDINSAKFELEKYTRIKYKEVLQFKLHILHKIFDNIVMSDLDSNLLNQTDYKAFIRNNGEWLIPYALYSYYAEKYGTYNFRRWPHHNECISREMISKEISQIEANENDKNKLIFIYWVQFICDLQFKEVKKFAERKKIALEGILPIGISINSSECWFDPQNFRFDFLTGIPPTDSLSNGINWGFPAYNWEYIEKNEFSYFKKRVLRMAELFHAIQIDHAFGMCRSWEIPANSSPSNSILGHSNPGYLITRQELEDHGICRFDEDPTKNTINRFIKPYVREHILQSKFGNDSKIVKEKFFVARNSCSLDDFLDFKDSFTSEQSIIQESRNVFSSYNDEESLFYIEQSLLQLYDNVLLIPERIPSGYSSNYYHARAKIGSEEPVTTRPQQSSSFYELTDDVRNSLSELINYAYYKEIEMWKEKGGYRFSLLKKSTNAMICADFDDYGAVPTEVINELSSLGIYGIFNQRMLDPNSKSNNDYLSFTTPSTIRSKPLRLWWETKSNEVNDICYNRMHSNPVNPSLEISTIESIIENHMSASSAFATFLLQDLLAVEQVHIKQTAANERICDPTLVGNAAQSQNYRYRCPFQLNDIIQNIGLTNKLYLIAEKYRRVEIAQT